MTMETKTKASGIMQLFKVIMIEDVPSYANKIFYSLGFLSMICFVVLLITGIIMVFFGPDWWFTTHPGEFMRSLHLWAIQAFVVFLLLHIFIVFSTGGYRPPRRFVWVLGSLMFFLVLMEAEFGYVLRGDFSSQWRSLQGADLYNGSGLGRLINNLNYAQVYGIHIIVIPFIILGLLFLHYGLVRLRGIAIPYKKNYPFKVVKANHTLLFLRGLLLLCILVVLAVIFPSPLIAPVTIEQVASSDPALMAKTLVGEIDHSSDTATYSDNIDPYQFDTMKVYIEDPYQQYLKIQPSSSNMLTNFSHEDKATQDSNIKAAEEYFNKNGTLNTSPNTKNPVIPLVSSLVFMGQSGLFEASLRNEAYTGYNPTFVLRFLSDTGVLEDQATNLGITTPQYGMLREEKVTLPPGAWWLAPLGFMDNTILKNDDNQDRDGAEILGVFMLLFLTFPYIPFLNRLPEPLGIYTLIWKDKTSIPRAEKTSLD